MNRDEHMPYGDGNVPYYEYSSVQRPIPVTRPQLSPQLPAPPVPRSRHKGRALMVSLVSGVLVIGVILALVFSHVLFPLATPSPTASFHAAACPFQPGDGIVEGQTVKCGYVTVPEVHSKPNGTKIRLAVAIFKAPNVENDPSPVIRLEGGPGGSSLDNFAHVITKDNYPFFVFHHDLIMFDQRGTGYSTPSLACPEVFQLQIRTQDTFLNANDAERLQLQAMQTCRDRLVRSGVNLNAYNSLENAADVHDLIQALGYQQANLYGVSYGTRLALTTMRLYPSVIRSVVLDSVYPPQKNRTDLPSDAQHIFTMLFQGCAANAQCNARYPNLDRVFYQLVTNLNATPVHFTATDTTSNQSYDVVMAGNDFVFVLFSAFYVTQFIPNLPQMIFQVRDGDFSTLSQMYGGLEFDNTNSDGMFYSDECSEDWAFLNQSDITASLQGLAPEIQPALRNSLQQEYDTCQLWHVQPVPAAQKQAVVSDIPTLVLSDEYDPITPPANGKLAAQTLKNSFYFVFPGLGHGAEYNSPCVDNIISNFDDTPTQKPSSTCITNMQEPNFT